ncbi:MAG TPA: hypothetical protein VHE60_08275 [Pyrinomonadaceae bacterium]|nr:hypothetical protein [Pyrinomonadaceae bacterium]
MPVQQAIEVTERNILARNLAELAVHLSGGEDLTLLGALLETFQKGGFLSEGEISPAAPASTPALQTSRPVAIVLAHPEPHRLLGDAQQGSDVVGSKRPHVSQPNGQTLLVLLATVRFPNPSLQVLRAQPRFDRGGSSHLFCTPLRSYNALYLMSIQYQPCLPRQVHCRLAPRLSQPPSCLLRRVPVAGERKKIRTFLRALFQQDWVVYANTLLGLAVLWDEWEPNDFDPTLLGDKRA